MKALKVCLILLLILAILAGLLAAGWFFVLRDGATMAALADHVEDAGRYDWALRLRGWAISLHPEESELRLKQAATYAGAGNYTKCEATLWDAIETNPGELELYRALSRAYVAQDKLLDASRLASSIQSESIRAAFNAERPAKPEIQPEAGTYDYYCNVSLSYGSGTAYWTINGDFPSTQTDCYSAPQLLDSQQSTVIAVVVDENGLVSDAVSAQFQIGAVDEPVSIEDPELERLLRERLSLVESAPLTTLVLAQLEELTLTAGIEDLSQLSLLIGLKTLDATALTGVRDWTCLAAMGELETLLLPPEPLDSASMEAIASLGTLKRLSMPSCGITTLAPLASLTNLEELVLDNNSIGDLTPLSGMRYLRVLRLGGNAVTDLKPLSGLLLLEELLLEGNPLTTLAPLGELTAMRVLDVSNTGCDVLSPLSGMTRLEAFSAAGNGVRSVNFLSKMSNLQKLDLSQNVITDISALANLTELTELNVSNNKLTEMPDFNDSCKLTFLYAMHNKLSDLSGLGMLMRLNYIYVDYNEITDLTVLSTCYNLVQVDAFENPTRDAAALVDSGVIVHYTPVFDEPDDAE